MIQKKHTPIFPPWHVSKWQAVDDRVRGGSSQSHLEVVGSKDSSEEGIDVVDRDNFGQSSSRVRFWGNLDTQTLGGAGFASQRYTFAPTPLNLSRAKYSGICITAKSTRDDKHSPSEEKEKPSLPKTYTIVLNSSTPAYPDPKPTPGPRPSALTYEAEFTPTSESQQFCIPWESFEATYRGKKVPNTDPKWKVLETDTIFEFSIMCRSLFAKQEGDFSIIIDDISGMKVNSQARGGCVSGLVEWFNGMWSSPEGQVRLEGGEKQ